MEQQKTQYTIKFRMLNPEGKYEWIQNNTSATYDSNGNVLRRIVQARNITNRLYWKMNSENKTRTKISLYEYLGMTSEIHSMRLLVFPIYCLKTCTITILKWWKIWSELLIRLQSIRTKCSIRLCSGLNHNRGNWNWK